MAVVEAKVLRDAGLGLGDGFVGMQINLIALDRSPQPLDEYVAPPAALAVHANTDAAVLEQTGERRAGELTALIDGKRLGGGPKRGSASSTASKQSSTSIEIDTCQASTRREYQSTTAARYTKPRAIGLSGEYHHCSIMRLIASKIRSTDLPSTLNQYSLIMFCSCCLLDDNNILRISLSKLS